MVTVLEAVDVGHTVALLESVELIVPLRVLVGERDCDAEAVNDAALEGEIDDDGERVETKLLVEIPVFVEDTELDGDTDLEMTLVRDIEPEEETV